MTKEQRRNEMERFQKEMRDVERAMEAISRVDEEREDECRVTKKSKEV